MLRLKNILFSFLFLTVSCIAASGQATAPTQEEPQDLDTELNNPVVNKKQSAKVRMTMTKQAQSLIDQGYNVELMRDDQVVAVTIPLDLLFGANDVNLLQGAVNLLQPFMNYTRHYGRYKILIAVHSDDTGSKNYQKWLCEQRILTLYDYFDTHGTTPAMVYGYPMGHDQPLVEDNSRTNRSTNRRLEIYIVPGPEMLNTISNKK